MMLLSPLVQTGLKWLKFIWNYVRQMNSYSQYLSPQAFCMYISHYDDCTPKFISGYNCYLAHNNSSCTFRKKYYAVYVSKGKYAWSYFLADTAPFASTSLYIFFKFYFYPSWQLYESIFLFSFSIYICESGCIWYTDLMFYDIYRNCSEKCKKCPICRVSIEERMPVYDV